MEGLHPVTVREALQAAIQNAGLDKTVAVHAYDPGAPHHQYPALIIGHGTGVDYAITFGPRGIAVLNLQVEIRTSAVEPAGGGRQLDELLAAGTGANSSVFDALRSDPTLGGVVGDCTVKSATPPRYVDDESGTYWTSTLPITVHQARSA